MSPSPAPSVFLSYAREDVVWARELARLLGNAGTDVFVDVESLRAGDDWPERLRREIAARDRLYLVWSRYAAQSEWVRREYTMALQLAAERQADGFIHVDLLDDTPLPAKLAHIQAERSALGTPGTDRLIRDPYRKLPPGPPQPSALLRPEYEVVPFHGRREILEQTEAWCLSGQPFGLVLYIGAGGSGKTRLFAEACSEMRGQGWETGFLDTLRMREALRNDTSRVDWLLHPRLPRLIVIDYAESRRDEVEAILTRAVDKRDGQAVRVVLLARSAGDLWSELLRSCADFGVIVGAGTQPIQLPPLAPEVEEREQALQAALAAFGGALGLDPMAPAPVDLSAPHFGQPLFLHLTALLTVLGTHEAGPRELLDALLDHEIRYWESVARGRGIGLDPSLVPALPQAVALITLVGGVAVGGELQQLIARTPLLSDRTRAEHRAVSQVLRRLYGWEGRVEALQPDRVGEALVARELEEDDALRHAWYADASESQLRQGLTVLGRIAADREEGREWLVELLSAETRRFLQPAMEVAIEGVVPVASALTEAFEKRADLQLAREVEPELPQYTVVLRELAATITSQAVIASLDEPEHAGLLNNLGVRLSQLGCREEALAATQEAVEIQRQLAQAQPDAFLPDLALSLNNLGSDLSDLGRREEALTATQEAVDAYRQLAQARPDAFLPDLAGSLNNLGIGLSNLGCREEALAAVEEAVYAYRRLASVYPAAFLPNLATRPRKSQPAAGRSRSPRGCSRRCGGGEGDPRQARRNQPAGSAGGVRYGIRLIRLWRSCRWYETTGRELQPSFGRERSGWLSRPQDDRRSMPGVSHTRQKPPPHAPARTNPSCSARAARSARLSSPSRRMAGRGSCSPSAAAGTACCRSPASCTRMR